MLPNRSMKDVACCQVRALNDYILALRPGMSRAVDTLYRTIGRNPRLIASETPTIYIFLYLLICDAPGREFGPFFQLL